MGVSLTNLRLATGIRLPSTSVRCRPGRPCTEHEDVLLLTKETAPAIEPVAPCQPATAVRSRRSQGRPTTSLGVLFGLTIAPGVPRGVARGVSPGVAAVLAVGVACCGNSCPPRSHAESRGTKSSISTTAFMRGAEREVALTLDFGVWALDFDLVSQFPARN